VKCRHGLTVGYSFGPACFKKGSYIIVSLVLDDTPEDKVVVDWHHVENGLYRAIGVDSNGNPVTEETAFMSLPVQEQGQGVGKVFIMGPLPDWIEWCVLKVRVIFVHQGKQGRVGVSALHWCEIFTVLDEPKAPMNPAWVSVLRISCQWARGESTVEGAARKLTEMTHQNTTYDTEALLFCYPPLPDQGEYFYLKLFLNRGMRGQCNEIADFLCCLMTSVGIRASVQRTNRRPFPKEAAFWTNKLLIRELREGELLTYRHHRWHYHQYVLFNCSPQSVYDGTVRFHPTVVHPYYPHQAPDYGYVVGWVRGGVPSDGDWARAETTYRRFLVSPYIPLSDPPQTYTILWEPTPEPSGFIPAVYASDQVTCQR
jgi:hypothetical protein